MNGFAFRGTVWFRGETENYLNCYNSRNICHSEERFSVLESPSYALLDDIFGRLKLENFYNPLLWRHQIWRHNMIFWHRFSLQMIKTPIQGSVQSFVRKKFKECKLALDDPVWGPLAPLWKWPLKALSEGQNQDGRPSAKIRIELNWKIYFCESLI